MDRRPALALSLLLLAGCSSGGGADEPRAQEASEAAPSTEPSGSPAAAATDGPVLASREAGVNGVPALVEIVSLRRDGTLAHLDLRLTNRGDGAMNLAGGTFGTGALDNTLAGVSLVDGTNRKRHIPVQDSSDRCLCSDTLISLRQGESVVFSATYAAPPEDVPAVTVEVPRFGTFDEVALED